jgi:hypothetical protein
VIVNPSFSRGTVCLTIRSAGHSMPQLIPALLRTALEPSDSTWPERARPILTGASPSAWRYALEELDGQWVVSLVGSSIVSSGLAESVPQSVLSCLLRANEQHVKENQARMASLAELLTLLRENGIEPIVLKSTALVAIFYPELAGRQMSDIDLYVALEHRDSVHRIVVSMGYAEDRTARDGRDYLQHSTSRRFDIHHRVRLFERFDLANLVIDVRAPFPPLDIIRVFEPNAMLVHLVFHMFGHSPDCGFALRCILDIGTVLQAWGSKFDLARIDHLLPSRKELCWLLRTIHFFRSELGMDVPELLLEPARQVKPITLSEVFRSQRLARWPLSRVRGWLRLAACILGLRQRGPCLYPQWSDLLLWPTDIHRERGALANTPRSLVRTNRPEVSSP